MIIAPKSFQKCSSYHEAALKNAQAIDFSHLGTRQSTKLFDICCKTLDRLNLRHITDGMQNKRLKPTSVRFDAGASDGNATTSIFLFYYLYNKTRMVRLDRINENRGGSNIKQSSLGRCKWSKSCQYRHRKSGECSTYLCFVMLCDFAHFDSAKS